MECSDLRAGVLLRDIKNNLGCGVMDARCGVCAKVRVVGGSPTIVLKEKYFFGGGYVSSEKWLPFSLE